MEEKAETEVIGVATLLEEELGNPGGSGSGGGARYGGTGYPGASGTGGLLIIYAENLYNNGTVSSNGSNGGNGYAPGGGSGGGSINLFYTNSYKAGTITANGGIGGFVANGRGANGGAGSIAATKVEPVIQGYLNYPEKELVIDITESYTLDKNKLEYINQENPVTIGNISFESLDTSIANVSNTGRITPIGLGQTKIKITDLANKKSTYVYVKVKNNVLPSLNIR